MRKAQTKPSTTLLAHCSLNRDDVLLHEYAIQLLAFQHEECGRHILPLPLLVASSVVLILFDPSYTVVIGFHRWT